jgi:hypothetical protein
MLLLLLSMYLANQQIRSTTINFQSLGIDTYIGPCLDRYNRTKIAVQNNENDRSDQNVLWKQQWNRKLAGQIAATFVPHAVFHCHTCQSALTNITSRHNKQQTMVSRKSWKVPVTIPNWRTVGRIEWELSLWGQNRAYGRKNQWICKLHNLTLWSCKDNTKFTA